MGRTVRLTPGNDSFTQGLSAANIGITVLGLAGNDRIILNRSDDSGGRNRVDAGLGRDVVISSKEDGNTILLGDGNDIYLGEGFGSFSNELQDLVTGGGGNDTFLFSTFNSRYKGDGGNDSFFSVGWSNTIDGGAGQDSVNYQARQDESTLRDTGVTLDLAAGIVETGSNRIERLISIEHATGSDANDQIFGSAVGNRLSGAGGLDALTGGGGADRFIFLKPSDARVFTDLAEIITDFSRTQADKIDLSAIDAVTGTTGNQAFRFVGSATFSGQKGELRVSQNAPNEQLVQGDIDGDRNPDFQFLVAGVSSMLSSDFIL